MIGAEGAQFIPLPGSLGNTGELWNRCGILLEVFNHYLTEVIGCQIANKTKEDLCANGQMASMLSLMFELVYECLNSFVLMSGAGQAHFLGQARGA